VAQNSKKALSYYKRAAIIGYAPAQYNLGMMYWQADGVAYDRDEASKWLSMAAQQAYPPARAWQERQNMTMTPMPDAPTRGGEK
jgi:TPR repeat protein